MSTGAPTRKRSAPTRDERSRRTRERLLDATIESLIEVGYRRSSMREICERAGVSRGAQLHHYPTKAALMAGAIEHLTRKQSAALERAGRALPDGPDRAAAMVDLIWAGFSGPLARAALELWTASSTDAELRERLLPVDRALGRATLEIALGEAHGLDPERVEVLFWLTVNLVRGLAVDELLGGDRRRRERLLDTWKQLARDAAASG